jgi:hypothetical protein
MFRDGNIDFTEISIVEQKYTLLQGSNMLANGFPSSSIGCLLLPLPKLQIRPALVDQGEAS